MELVLVVLGAVVGALATGGVSAWAAWQERQLRRKVAARVILGDLYVIEGALELIRDTDRWPDRWDAVTPLTTWQEQRTAFAGGVRAWEWALVDGLYSDLARTVPMIRPGEACTDRDRKVVLSVLGKVPRARERVLIHSASEDEREELVREIGTAQKADS